MNYRKNTVNSAATNAFPGADNANDKYYVDRVALPMTGLYKNSFLLLRSFKVSTDEKIDVGMLRYNALGMALLWLILSESWSWDEAYASLKGYSDIFTHRKDVLLELGDHLAVLEAGNVVLSKKNLLSKATKIINSSDALLTELLLKFPEPSSIIKSMLQVDGFGTSATSACGILIKIINISNSIHQ